MKGMSNDLTNGGCCVAPNQPRRHQERQIASVPGQEECSSVPLPPGREFLAFQRVNLLFANMCFPCDQITINHYSCTYTIITVLLGSSCCA
ncbi:hypothetical protein CEXT_82691 [Caerostris extrusa]|uniref:Uncharacterized protein n=1 Tax=Caerostris extrusa TaxID=172846 RepID=A0AAV4MB20_CAEEX|nr:hypothetical protein CEXT_82691 [Caerostris extrusa]